MTICCAVLCVCACVCVCVCVAFRQLSLNFHAFLFLLFIMTRLTDYSATEWLSMRKTKDLPAKIAHLRLEGHMTHFFHKMEGPFLPASTCRTSLHPNPHSLKHNHAYHRRFLCHPHGCHLLCEPVHCRMPARHREEWSALACALAFVLILFLFFFANRVIF